MRGGSGPPRGGTLWAAGKGRHPGFESPVLKQFFLKIVGSMLLFYSFLKSLERKGFCFVFS